MDLTLSFGHVIIAGAYIILALFAPFLKFETIWETWMARVGWCGFFLGCGLTHLHKLGHVLTGDPIGADPIHATAVGLQVVGAPMFIISALPYVRHFPKLMRSLPEVFGPGP